MICMGVPPPTESDRKLADAIALLAWRQVQPLRHHGTLGRNRLVDPAAAEQAVAVIEHRRLAR
jgi:hypothetical protein